MSFFCGSNKILKFQRHTDQGARFQSDEKNKKIFPKGDSNLGIRALSMVKLMSWKNKEAIPRRGEEEDDEDDDGDEDDSDEAIWRKTIMRGERCRPLDFSGKIDYDCKGNPVSSPSYCKGCHDEHN